MMGTDVDIDDTGPRQADDFLAQLDRVDDEVPARVAEVIRKGNDSISLTAHQAEWHVRGLTYHARKMIRRYASVGQGIAERANLRPEMAAVIIHDPSVQQLLFEFYAIVNLARISLDNLRNVLGPVFTTQYGQLPKSITDFTLGSTNCPVYEMLAREPMVEYLSDIRNCLVHYRPFATSDNAIAVAEGLGDSATLDDLTWLQPMTKAVFRKMGNDGVVVNMYLPDRIFELDQGGNKVLVDFTYQYRINMLSQSVSFVLLVASATIASLQLLVDPGSPTYSYHKRSRARRGRRYE